MLADKPRQNHRVISIRSRRSKSRFAIPRELDSESCVDLLNECLLMKALSCDRYLLGARSCRNRVLRRHFAKFAASERLQILQLQLRIRELHGEPMTPLRLLACGSRLESIEETLRGKEAAYESLNLLSDYLSVADPITSCLLSRHAEKEAEAADELIHMLSQRIQLA